MLNMEIYLNEVKNKEKVSKDYGVVVDDLSFEIDEDLGLPDLKFTQLYSGQRIAEALFARKPLMKIADSRYLISGHPFLKIQMTHKFLQKAFDFARKVEGEKSSKFSQFVGKRLERFFDELCSYWDPLNGHHVEYEYIKKSNKKSSDHIVFEKDGNDDVVLLFQVKTKDLLETVFYGTSKDTLEVELGKYCEFIYKSIIYLYELNNAVKQKNLRGDYKAISERVLSAKKCCLVGVTPIDPAIFTILAMRKKLIFAVENKVGSTVWKWFQEKYEAGNWNWHILGLEHFEIFLNLPKAQRNFHDCFQQYLKASGIDSVLADKVYGIPDSFRNFIIKRFEMKRNFEEVPNLKFVFENYFKRSASYFFSEEVG